MKKRVGFLTLFLTCSIYGQESDKNDFFDKNVPVRLEETIITESGFKNTIRNTAKNITIITAKDIKENGASNIIEALKSVPGVTSNSGVSSTGNVDIRGQGASSNTNTAIIVDGVKMNSIDLSGFNFYSIPIEIVERIEVIPSGASVIYGDNSVGGAINIITKNGKSKKKVTLNMGVGSYNNLNGNIGFNTKINRLKIFGNIGGKNTAGYRKNSDLKLEDIMSGLFYEINPYNSLKFKYSYHRDNKGFPGPLTESQKDQNRKQSLYKDDWGKTNSNRFDLYHNYKKNSLEIINNITYYKKKYRSYMYKMKSKSISKNMSGSLKIKYRTTRDKLISGIDILNGDIDDKLQYSWSKKQSVGGFILNTYSLTDKIDFISGLRQQHVKYKYSSSGNKNYDITVYNLALNDKYSETGSLFLSYGTDFRTPTTDELLEESGNINKNLMPQTGQNIEMGVKDYIAETFISASIFYKIIKDEIYFNPFDQTGGTLGTNSNYENSNKKIGFEILVEKEMMKNLKLTSSYSYLKSEIDENRYKGNDTPGVPNSKFSVGSRYKFRDNLIFNISVNYVGSSYLYGDFENKYSRVNPHTTVDIKVLYKINNSFILNGGIKNLTDKKYSEYAGNNGYGAYNYPAAGRNYFFGFEYSL